MMIESMGERRQNRIRCDLVALTTVLVSVVFFPASALAKAAENKAIFHD